ncbi:MAG: SHOCT-like domain-containing protein [Bacillota bacterium]
MSKEEKMLILQMVADGKITPEQGAELLRAVGEPKPVAPPRPASAPLPQKAGEAKPEAVGDDVGPALDKQIRETIEASVEASGAEGPSRSRGAPAKHAEKFAERIALEGENLGKVLGESGENLGKIFARIFGWRLGIWRRKPVRFPRGDKG